MVIAKSLRRHAAALAVAAVAASAACAAQAGTLRICADPDNLPFSKAEGPERGLYVELATLVSQHMGETPEFVWWLTYNQRKALRNTILQDGCDAYFALPESADYRVRGLAKTHAFLQVSYAIVAPPDLKVSRLEDLRGKRLGVSFGSPPQMLLASREGYTTTTYRETEQAMAALGRGEIDAALLWGPIAGYENQRHLGNRFVVTPVQGEGMGGGVAVGVRREPADLAPRIDKALTELQPQIRELALKYGFPVTAPMVLSATRVAPSTPVARAPATTGRAVARAGSTGLVAVAVAATPADMAAAGVVRVAQASPAAPPTQVANASPAADANAVTDGQKRFNNTCSHCHGNNGASAVSERDLRKLNSRYKDKWREVASTTIHEGRPDLGMPTWKGTFNDREISEILAFLGTIQR